MLKLEIKGKDILPYILIFINLLLFAVFQLSVRNIIKLKYELELGCFTFIIFIFSMINYIKRIHTPENVVLSELVSTEDIRTPSFKYSGIINRGNEISYIKLYFSKKAIYLYYRNFFPIKIYYGPFYINSDETNSLNNFLITEFKITSKTEARLSISSKNGFTNYTFYMKNISKRDLDLLEKRMFN